MCLPKVCCCGCTLRQGTVGIIVCDSLWLLWQLLWAIIFAIILEVADDITQENLDLFKLLVWIIAITPLIRFIGGMISACSNFASKNKLIHFVMRVIADTLDLFLYIILMSTLFQVGQIISLMVFLFFAVYFNWILFAFYKEEDQPSKAPVQNVVVIQGSVPQAGYPQTGYPVQSHHG